jgi:hypothetical protein
MVQGTRYRVQGAGCRLAKQKFNDIGKSLKSFTFGGKFDHYLD